MTLKAKNTVNFNLDEKSAKILDDLCKSNEMTRSGMLRRCLKLYSIVEEAEKAGKQLAFKESDGSYTMIIKV